MPKSPHHGGKGRKGRKSRRYARPSAPMAAKPPASNASVSATRLAPQQTSAARLTPQQAPAARLTSRPVSAIQQAALSYPHILGELKTIGIIAGALLILIIVLSVVV